MSFPMEARPIGCLLLTCVCRLAIAQTASTPGAHFGALVFPRDRPGYEMGIHLNRFTEFDKASMPVDGIEQPIRFNGIDKTYGFNLGALAVTNHLSNDPRLLYRVTLQAGITSDEPTEFLQNDVIHEIRNIPHVPVGESPTQFDADVELQLERWFGETEGNHAFAGGGIAIGTINQDAYLQIGGRSAPIKIRAQPALSVTGVVRGGLPAGGLSFHQGDIADRYAMGQVAGSLSFVNCITRGILPVLDMGLTYSTGFFVTESGHSIDRVFWTIRFSWSDKFAFETWNDSLNDTDRGPTYGARITTSFKSLPFLDRISGMPR